MDICAWCRTVTVDKCYCSSCYKRPTGYVKREIPTLYLQPKDKKAGE